MLRILFWRVDKGRAGRLVNAGLGFSSVRRYAFGAGKCISVSCPRLHVTAHCIADIAWVGRWHERQHSSRAWGIKILVA